MIFKQKTKLFRLLKSQKLLVVIVSTELIPFRDQTHHIFNVFGWFVVALVKPAALLILVKRCEVQTHIILHVVAGCQEDWRDCLGLHGSKVVEGACGRLWAHLEANARLEIVPLGIRDIVGAVGDANKCSTVTCHPLRHGFIDEIILNHRC